MRLTDLAAIHSMGYEEPDKFKIKDVDISPNKILVLRNIACARNRGVVLSVTSTKRNTLFGMSSPISILCIMIPPSMEEPLEIMVDGKNSNRIKRKWSPIIARRVGQKVELTWD